MEQQKNLQNDQQQMVSFRLGEESYCIEIAKVREINRLERITPFPETPSFIEGAIYLRGELIPVLNLKSLFSLPDPGSRSKATRIMIVETGSIHLGFIVDEVKEVHRISSDQIEPVPDLITSQVRKKYIKGVIMVRETPFIVLDSASIFTQEEIQQIAAVHAA